MHARTLVTAATSAVCFLLLTASSAGAFCFNPGHWYGAAWSGYGAEGTDLDSTMPQSNKVTGSGSTSDEAAWLINNSNNANSLECGWFIGYWPYGNHGFFNQFQTYITWDNGSNGALVGPPIPALSNLRMQATNRYNCTFVSSAKGTSGYWLNYHVSNGLNYGQGEVTTTSKTCMGGCSPGELFNAFWTSNGTTWTPWAFMSSCQNSPYWVSRQNNYVYKNGGGG